MFTLQHIWALKNYTYYHFLKNATCFLFNASVSSVLCRLFLTLQCPLSSDLAQEQGSHMQRMWLMLYKILFHLKTSSKSHEKVAPFFIQSQQSLVGLGQNSPQLLRWYLFHQDRAAFLLPGTSHLPGGAVDIHKKIQKAGIKEIRSSISPRWEQDVSYSCFPTSRKSLPQVTRLHRYLRVYPGVSLTSLPWKWKEAL